MPQLTTDIATAAAKLRDGGVAAIPTETVYGLAGLADNDTAVKHVFALKRRPENHPLILHTANFGKFADYAEHVPDTAHKLAEAFLPGPLTMLLPRRGGVAAKAAADSRLVALRVPSHPAALELLGMLPGALAAPSANRFGRISPTCAGHVADDYRNMDDLLILDGGPCEVGLESTVAEVGENSVRIVRPGCVTARMIRRAAGVACLPPSQGKAAAPGSCGRHYAPRTPLTTLPGEEFARLEDNTLALLGFRRPAHCATANWAAMSADPDSAARNMYRLIRILDNAGCARMIVELPPDLDKWAAVRDRLNRAAVRG